jgi:hypothetical protein
MPVYSIYIYRQTCVPIAVWFMVWLYGCVSHRLKDPFGCSNVLCLQGYYGFDRGYPIASVYGYVRSMVWCWYNMVGVYNPGGE